MSYYNKWTTEILPVVLVYSINTIFPHLFGVIMIYGWKSEIILYFIVIFIRFGLICICKLVLKYANHISWTREFYKLHNGKSLVFLASKLTEIQQDMCLREGLAKKGWLPWKPIKKSTSGTNFRSTPYHFCKVRNPWSWKNRSLFVIPRVGVTPWFKRLLRPQLQL